MEPVNFVLGVLNSDRFMQLEKAPSPMYVMSPLNSIFEQPLYANAELPIWTRFMGILKSLRLIQSLKAKSLMMRTLFGRVLNPEDSSKPTFSSFSQKKNAP